MDVPLPAKVGVDFLGLPPSARELGPPPGRTIDVIAGRGCFGVMHYQLDGPRDGELCVWVHGLGDFCKHSDLLAAALIAGGYRVLRFDFFGRGWSDSPAGAAYAAIALAVPVLPHLQLGTADAQLGVGI